MRLYIRLQLIISLNNFSQKPLMSGFFIKLPSDASGSSELFNMIKIGITAAF
jgi:hypothetical protein